MTSLVNDKVEEATLAALLVDPVQIPLVASKLQPDDFGVPANRKAYSTMVRLSQEGRRVDAITLNAEGVDIGYVLDNLAGTETHDLDEYSGILLDASFRRRVDEFGTHIKQVARTGESQAEILGELQAFGQAVSHDAIDTRLIGSSRAVDLYLEELAARKVRGLGLQYGIEELDDYIQPVEGGDMVIVAARPSVGKTAMAENIVDFWALGAEKPVLFVSLEMRVNKLLDRGASRWSGVPTQKVLRGTTSPEEDAILRDAAERRRVLNIWYVDDPQGTTNSVRAAAAKVALMHGGLTGIVVDYLQILKDAGEQETQRVTRISRNLKALAREFDTPLIALSQLNRQSEYRTDGHPRLSDIRESGAIEQDADVVFGLHRYPQSRVLSLDVLKNRQGPAGDCLSIAFDADTVSLGRERT